MPIHSRWEIPLDVCSFQTFIFGQPGASLPDRVAFFDADRPDTHYLTLESFRSWAQRLAVGLRKAGLQPSDRVLLFSGNNIWFPVVFVGVLMAGGIFTGANPGYVARELAYQLKDSGSKYLLCADASLELGVEAAGSIGMSQDQIFRFHDDVSEKTSKSTSRIKDWTSLLATEAEAKDFAWYEPEDPKDTICCLNYSSGTTGLPKGVINTHYNYIANTTQSQYAATRLRDNEEGTETSKWLCYLPMYHAMAQSFFISAAPKQGIPVYIMKKFDFVQMLEAVQKYKITRLIMVPPIVVALAKSPLTKKYDLSSVTDTGCGAAPLGGDAIVQFEALWPAGDRKLKQGWGMTEVTCFLAWDPTVESVPDSVGELNPNCHAKIMDMDSKNEVKTGERGELWVQAPNVMKGYWKNDKATAEVFVDGPDGRWMRTGDIAYVDDKGRFYIVDRMKELIKVKGNQVAPAELEALLLEHPQISDAAVVGVVIQGEEVPRAYVVVENRENVTEKEIERWLSERVSKHKRIVGGCVFTDAVPKNPSGKILRRFLRERAQEEVGDKMAKL